jgi:hypothetical protein
MRDVLAVAVALALLVSGGTVLAQQQLDPGADAAASELDVDTDLPLAPILLGSFGLVLVGVGAGFGWQADQEHDRWDEARKAGDPNGQMDGLADDIKAHSIAANVLMFSGAGIAAISVIWLIAGSGDEEAEGASATALLTPDIGPGRAGLTLTF